MFRYVKSPLNYTGGKFKLLPYTRPLVPKNTDLFVDLMGGGFNVGVNMYPYKVIYNDIDLNVINILKYFYSNSIENIIMTHGIIRNLLLVALGR